MSAHAFLAPSGAPIWRYCALYPTMNARYPQEATEDTLAGEAAHWAFYEMLYARPVAVGQVAPNGVTLLDDMIEAAELYCDVIDRDLASVGLDRRWLQAERRVYMPRIHEQNWGTPDTWFYAEHLRRMFVYDFKYGHDFVDAYENYQCIDYTEGIAQQLGIDGLTDQATGVDIVVIQPRNYDRQGPVRRWQVTLSDLRPHFNTLRNQAEKAIQPQPEAAVNPKCKHCPGRHACNTLQRAGYEAAHLSRQSVPVELSPEALTLEYRMLAEAQEALKARVSGLYQEIETRLRVKGERMPRFRLQDTYGREAWKVPPEQVIAAGLMFGAQVGKPATLTPKQAVKAGMPVEVVARMSETIKTGVKLVPDDGRAAARVFGKST